jgi:XTP/dITP diphosphohydrolase
MTAQLVLATRNAHKLDELAEILGAAGVDVKLLPLPAGAPDVLEDGLTFDDNALKKARSAAAHTGLPAVADDSGLCVDVLNGMPGIFSARWAGTGRDDAANLALVLDQVAEVPDDHLGARFVCAAAVALPSGEERVVEGQVLGRLVRSPRGTGGFGYDPIFKPDGYDVTTAEMTAEAKHAISHRGEAFRALAPVLRELLLP